MLANAHLIEIINRIKLPFMINTLGKIINSIIKIKLYNGG